ncbi:MAG: hypothetical protein ACKOA5_08070 [Actinomycetota bacterium]
MDRPLPQLQRADWVNRRLTLGIFLAAAGRGGAAWLRKRSKRATRS